MRQYDYSKLLGRIKERGFTPAAPKRLGISPCTLNLSLNNKRGFRRDRNFLCHWPASHSHKRIGQLFFYAKVSDH